MVRKMWTQEEKRKLEKLCKRVSSFPELKKKIKETGEFPGRSWMSIKSKVYAEELDEHFDKNPLRKWKGKEEILKKICKSAQSLEEVKRKVKREKTFEEMNWDAIRRKIHSNPEWTEHFGEGLTEIDDDLGLPPEELRVKLSRLLQIVKRGPTTVTKISEDPVIDIDKDHVWDLIDKLREKGYNIVEYKRRVYLKEEPMPGLVPSLPPLTKKENVKYMIMSDLGFGLKTMQGTLVATCLEIGEREGVFLNIIAGGLVGGKPYPRNQDEYFLRTVEQQAAYVVSRFPRTSFKHYLLNGPRELSFAKGKRGKKIEQLICRDRDDIRYLGNEIAYFGIGRPEAKIAVVAAGGAHAYTKSYPLQGIMENFQEAVYYVFEHSEPAQAVIVGGLYSGILSPRQFPVSERRYNDFDGVALPGLHRITPSQATQRRRGGSPVLGCLILGANFSKTGEFKGFTYTFYDLTPYFKKDDYLQEIEIDETLSKKAKKILSRLKKRPRRKGELARAIRKSIPHVEEIIEELKSKGYNIWFNEARKAFELRRPLKKKFEPLDLEKLFVTKVRFLATSDWHIGNKGERPDLIKRIFKIARKKKVNLILNCGNIFDGMGCYKGHELELIYHGADAQRNHLLEILPKSKIPMVMISSPLHEHEGVYWVKMGHDIVATFEEFAQLKDYRVRYLKESRGSHKGKIAQATFKYKDIKFDLQHPRGGIPYGKTYRLQKRIEMLVSAMKLISGAKATFVGHLHRAVFMLYKGMAGFLVPCLKEEDEYITSLDKLPELGCWVVELAFDEYKNLTKVELEYVPFGPKKEHMSFVNLDEDGLMKKWKANKRQAS